MRLLGLKTRSMNWLLRWKLGLNTFKRMSNEARKDIARGLLSLGDKNLLAYTLNALSEQMRQYGFSLHDVLVGALGGKFDARRLRHVLKDTTLVRSIAQGAGEFVTGSRELGRFFGSAAAAALNISKRFVKFYVDLQKGADMIELPPDVQTSLAKSGVDIMRPVEELMFKTTSTFFRSVGGAIKTRG